MVKIFPGWGKSMCEGYEGKQKDDNVKEQGDYCGWNRQSKKKGKLIRDEVTEEAEERKLVKDKNFKWW